MKKNISIIGGGSSALFLALFLDTNKYNVCIYEKNKTLGKKLMLAGNGGFNLSHSEPIQHMIDRYIPKFFLKAALLNFTNIDLQKYLYSIGIETYIGTSKRVYPTKDISPSFVLKKILKKIQEKSIDIKCGYKLDDWSTEGKLTFSNNVIVDSDYTIFALGGSSWAKTGSDGLWISQFTNKNIKCIDFQASNCSVLINWNNNFIMKNEGLAIKNISVTCNGKIQKGELMINDKGIEGNAIYPLANEIRKQINKNRKALISIDLKPMLSKDTIVSKIKNSKHKKISDILRKDLKLSNVQVDLLRYYLSKDEFLNIEFLVSSIKCFSLQIEDLGDIKKAISTVGGISIDELDDNFELIKLKNIFCIGEMIDWDAPTGGYLLQASFSMGVFLAKHFNSRN